MTIRLLLPLTAAIVAFHTGQVVAQNAFPAPLPNQAEAPANGASPIPHLNDASIPSAAVSGRSQTETCMQGFAALREEAEVRSRLIKEASDRRAPADEACRLIGDFGQAEIRMIKYIENNSAKCAIAPHAAERFRASHNNTEKMQRQVCAIAQQDSANGVPGKGRSAPAGPVGDFWFESDPLLRSINPF
jgi:hypothetical protein